MVLAEGRAASLGDDRTPIDRVTLALWRDAIVNVIERQSEPVVLVGHRRGGVVISGVAEAIPESVFALARERSAIDPEALRRMAAAAPYAKTASLDTSHTPFVSPSDA